MRKSVGETIIESMIETYGIEINLSPGPVREHLEILINLELEKQTRHFAMLLTNVLEEL